MRCAVIMFYDLPNVRPTMIKFMLLNFL